MAIEQLGRFKITGTLGQGAMGTVYRAHDPLIERTVAIKTVACAGLSKDEALAFEQRFYREAKSAGRLSHPNIVTIHDVGRNESLAFIAMEFLDGQSLRELLDSGVVLPAERCVEIAADVAEGLAFAHANGVVHRDIKPANIMVLANGSVKISDFGVALIPSGSTTVEGTAFGSPKYMSPEQVTGQKVDGRSDIFSLGAVLYEMLAGRPAFDGEELTAVLYQVLHAAPPLPSSFNPELPRVFDRLIAKSMAKDPDKRYQNAVDLAADLRKCRRMLREVRKKAEGDDPVRSKFQGRAASSPALAKAKQSPWLNAAALASAVSIVGALFWYYGSKPGVEAAPAVGVAENSLSAPVSAPDSLAPKVAGSATERGSEAVKEKSESAASLPVVQADGVVRLAIAPWGEVVVDGKIAGVSPPLTEVRLAPGKHHIEVRNTNFQPHRQVVEVVADKSIRIKHKFQ